MGRIVESERLPKTDAVHAHWGEAETVAGGPITVELPDGTLVTRANFLTKRNDYETMQDDLLEMDETQLPHLISQRETTWGTGPEDTAGVWFRLKQYKKVVRTKLGKRHPLSRIVPNLGEIQPGTLVRICHRFEDHWTRVLAVKPGVTIGPFTLAMLQAAHVSLHAIDLAEETLVEVTRPAQRSDMEHLYGDVADDDREDNSLVGIMLAYVTKIETDFAGQPIVDSLPEVFPDQGGPTLPTFRYNVIQQPGAVVKVFYEPPAPALANAALVFLKEGVIEITQPVTSTTPGSVQTHIFNGVTLVGDLDEFELRDGDGVTIARGVRDSALPEPLQPA